MGLRGLHVPMKILISCKPPSKAVSISECSKNTLSASTYIAQWTVLLNDCCAEERCGACLIPSRVLGVCNCHNQQFGIITDTQVTEMVSYKKTCIMQLNFREGFPSQCIPCDHFISLKSISFTFIFVQDLSYSNCLILGNCWLKLLNIQISSRFFGYTMWLCEWAEFSLQYSSKPTSASLMSITQYQRYHMVCSLVLLGDRLYFSEDEQKVAVKYGCYINMLDFSGPTFFSNFKHMVSTRYCHSHTAHLWLWNVILKITYFFRRTDMT